MNGMLPKKEEFNKLLTDNKHLKEAFTHFKELSMKLKTRISKIEQDAKIGLQKQLRKHQLEKTSLQRKLLDAQQKVDAVSSGAVEEKIENLQKEAGLLREQNAKFQQEVRTKDDKLTKLQDFCKRQKEVKNQAVKDAKKMTKRVEKLEKQMEALKQQRDDLSRDVERYRLQKVGRSCSIRATPVSATVCQNQDLFADMFLDMDMNSSSKPKKRKRKPSRLDSSVESNKKRVKGYKKGVELSGSKRQFVALKQPPAKRKASSVNTTPISVTLLNTKKASPSVNSARSRMQQGKPEAIVSNRGRSRMRQGKPDVFMSPKKKPSPTFFKEEPKPDIQPKIEPGMKTPISDKPPLPKKLNTRTNILPKVEKSKPSWTSDPSSQREPTDSKISNTGAEHSQKMETRKKVITRLMSPKNKNSKSYSPSLLKPAKISPITTPPASYRVSDEHMDSSDLEDMDDDDDELYDSTDRPKEFSPPKPIDISSIKIEPLEDSRQLLVDLSPPNASVNASSAERKIPNNIINNESIIEKPVPLKEEGTSALVDETGLKSLLTFVPTSKPVSPKEEVPPSPVAVDNSLLQGLTLPDIGTLLTPVDEGQLVPKELTKTAKPKKKKTKPFTKRLRSILANCMAKEETFESVCRSILQLLQDQLHKAEKERQKFWLHFDYILRIFYKRLLKWARNMTTLPEDNKWDMEEAVRIVALTHFSSLCHIEMAGPPPPENPNATSIFVAVQTLVRRTIVERTEQKLMITRARDRKKKHSLENTAVIRLGYVWWRLCLGESKEKHDREQYESLLLWLSLEPDQEHYIKMIGYLVTLWPTEVPTNFDPSSDSCTMVYVYVCAISAVSALLERYPNNPEVQSRIDEFEERTKWLSQDVESEILSKKEVLDTRVIQTLFALTRNIFNHFFDSAELVVEVLTTNDTELPKLSWELMRRLTVLRGLVRTQPQFVRSELLPGLRKKIRDSQTPQQMEMTIMLTSDLWATSEKFSHVRWLKSIEGKGMLSESERKHLGPRPFIKSLEVMMEYAFQIGINLSSSQKELPQNILKPMPLYLVISAIYALLTLRQQETLDLYLKKFPKQAQLAICGSKRLRKWRMFEEKFAKLVNFSN